VLRNGAAFTNRRTDSLVRADVLAGAGTTAVYLFGKSVEAERRSEQSRGTSPLLAFFEIVKNPAVEEPFRIWLAAGADSTIRPKVLMNASYFIAVAIKVRNHLTLSAKWFIRKGKSRMSAFTDDRAVFALL
jgi:hypothetical protein